MLVGSVNLGLGRTLPRPPRGAEQIRTTRRFQAGAGKGAHQALDARRLGADVTLLASVGRDAEHSPADLAAAGIGPGAVIVGHDHAATGTAVPLIACGGSRIVVDAGAGDLLKPAHVRALAADSRPPDVVVTDHELPALVVAAMLRAYAGRARVLLSPSPARALRPELLALVAPLVLGEGELAGLLALAPAPAALGTVAAVLERSGLGDSLVTLGSGGVVVLVQGATTHVPPFRVDANDKAGADDAFPGALTAPLTSGLTGGAAVHPTA